MMREKIRKGLLLLVPISLMSCGSSIPNAVTEKVKIYGNCGMCEETIETAAFQDQVAEADWDVNTKMATITFDSTKTDLDAILKRVAESGYDNDHFTAPQPVYDKLHTCCKYDRKAE